MTKEIANAALLVAVHNGDVEALKAALTAGADVNARLNQTESTALIESARLGKTSCLQFLLEAGADIEARDILGDTPLMLAARYWSTPCGTSGNSSAECAKILIAAGADVNACRKKSPATVCSMAAKGGSTECLQYLIQAGAEVQKTPDCGAFALDEAIDSGASECLKLLLEAGGMLSAHGSNPIITSALIRAARMGQASCLKVLLEAGADIEACDAKGYTPLMTAVIYWQKPYPRHTLQPENANTSAECAKILIAAGADVNACSKTQPDYVLSCAAEGGSPECLKSLMQAGAEVQKTHDKGLLALKTAVEAGHSECLKLLIEAGAEGCNRTRCAQDLAASAAAHGHTECLKLLIESGVDVSHGEALIVAAERGKSECVKILVEAGADINATNSRGETALMYMVENGYADAVKLLIAAGADINAASSVTGKKVKLKASCPQPQKDEIQDLLKTAESSVKLSAKQNKAVADMFSAVNENRVDELKALIESGVDVNASDDNEKNSLIRAASHGYVESVKLLLEAGAEKKEEALIYAAHYGYADCVSTLLKSGADADARRFIDNNLTSSLVAASTPEVLKLLLDAGANINYSAPNPMEIFTNSSMDSEKISGISWKIKMLIENGADVNYYGNNGFALSHVHGTKYYVSPLSKIIKAGFGLDVVKLMVAAGAEISPMYGESPLQAAASSQYLEIAEYLIDAGADVNARDHKNQSALSATVLHLNSGMAELLLRHGVDVSAEDEKRPLFYDLVAQAQYKTFQANFVENFIPLLKLLINAGANVNRGGWECMNKEAPLVCLIRGFAGEMNENSMRFASKQKHTAYVNIYKKAVQMLLKAKADVNVFSSSSEGGLSALMEAVKVGVPEVVEMLLLAGADVNATTESGKDVWKIKSDCAAPMKKQIKLLLEAAKAGNLISLTSDKKSEPKKATKNATTKKTTPSKKPTTKKKAE